ncbi:MAG: hypothetical protein EZS28_033334, partial [Streblomastix strix]
LSSIAELEQDNFTDITQSGTGSGAAISTVLNSGSSLKISSSSTFTRCKANNGLGGALYSQISDGQIELNKVTFTSCESKTGGAVYSTISGTGKLTVTNQCNFTSCKTSDSGGAIYTTISGGQLDMNYITFTSCTSSGLGGAYHAQISGGSADLNRVTMNECKGTYGGGINAIISGSGKLTAINQTQFTGCQGTQGNGGGIYAQINSGASSSVCISITGSNKTTFSSCTVPTASGLGGAIFLDFASGTETKYDLTGASYSTTTSSLNNALYGKNLFIKAANLRTAVPIGDTTRIKLGAINPETDFYKLMGVDGSNTLAVPLYYVYTAIISDIYHVNNAASTYTIGSGYNNTFCGHYGWPCLTIGYAIDQSGSATNKKVGIITGYKQIASQGIAKTGVQIQNSLTSTGSTSTTHSVLLIESAGKFPITSGTVQFSYISFSINTNAGSGYVITGSTSSTKITIDNCLMVMTGGTSSSISVGLVQLNVGSLSTSNLQVNNINIASNSVIKINNGAGEVNIIGSKFNSVSRTGTGNGAAINAELNGASKMTIKDGCQFTSCSCANGNGGAIYASLSSGASGSVSITGSASTFSSCTVSTTSGLGGAIYLDFASGTETKYDLTGASYQTGNDASYGKNLFIKAANLRTAVPIGDATRIKLGAINPETNMFNLMGYDNGITTLAVPLYFLYTAIQSDIFHVYNPTSPFQIGSGNNNRFCGHLEWPCLTIDYAISQNTYNVKKIGIMNEYQLNEQFEINEGGKEVQILNQLTDSGTFTDIKSIMYIEGVGKISITGGTLSINKIIFTINENATNGYVITGTATSTSISINNCIMKMQSDAEGYSILTGLIELQNNK